MILLLLLLVPSLSSTLRNQYGVAAGSSFVLDEAGGSSDGDTPSPSPPSAAVVVESLVESFVVTEMGVLVSALMVR